MSIINKPFFFLFVGHYICNIRDPQTGMWIEYDDKKARTIGEWSQMKERSTLGYIFFFIHDGYHI